MRRSLLAFALFFFASAAALAQTGIDTRGSVTNPGGSVIPGYDNRTCDSSIAGAVRFDSGASAFQGCDGSSWRVLHYDLCAGTPTRGDVCADGTYYIGEIATERVFATNEIFETTQFWNDGAINYTSTNATSLTDGAGNSTTIAAVDANALAPDFQGHDAVIYCLTLRAHGYDDWYLPARTELRLMYNGGATTGNVHNDFFYWSSTEVPTDHENAYSEKLADGTQTSHKKNNPLQVRCVRR